MESVKLSSKAAKVYNHLSIAQCKQYTWLLNVQYWRRLDQRLRPIWNVWARSGSETCRLCLNRLKELQDYNMETKQIDSFESLKNDAPLRLVPAAPVSWSWNRMKQGNETPWNTMKQSDETPWNSNETAWNSNETAWNSNETAWNSNETAMKRHETAQWNTMKHHEPKINIQIDISVVTVPDSRCFIGRKQCVSWPWNTLFHSDSSCFMLIQSVHHCFITVSSLFHHCFITVSPVGTSL